jgi:hypothetical protein
MVKKYFIIYFISVLFAGCATVAPGAIRVDTTEQIPKIQEEYQDRLEKTHLEMSVAELKVVWPEALKVGEDSEYVIYEFKRIHTYYTSYDYNLAFNLTGAVNTHEYVQKILFYFSDNKLKKYEYLTHNALINQ